MNAIFFVTVFVPRSITDIESEYSLTTYACVPSGVIARAVGIVPVGKVEVIVLDVVSAIDTEPPLALATRMRFPLGVTATQSGEVNPEIVESRVPVGLCTVTTPTLLLT